MSTKPAQAQTSNKEEEKGEEDDAKLDDMLQELRILLQGAQVLTAFLTILPFSQGFEKLDDLEKWIYLSTFICSISSLICFTAPAAYHRLSRPLTDRVRYKDLSTGLAIAGLALASVSLTLATQLVVSSVKSGAVSYVMAGIVALLITGLWWILPLASKDGQKK